VADFGVARRMSSTGEMTAETGTYRWMAPEVIKHAKYDERIDVYSFAIILWELLTSRLPYADMPSLAAAAGVVERGLRPPVPPDAPPAVADMLQRCWAADASGALAPPAAAQARALGAQLAHGLAHMHGRGVLHRDLKPANVVLAPGRSRGRAGDDVAPLRAVIVDLGLAAFAPGGVVADAEGGAAAADPSPSPDDGHTGGVGTATYAAPEQASGRGYGPPADVYSLGLILLELLCRFGTGMERARAMAAARAGTLPAEALERGAPGAAALARRLLEPRAARRWRRRRGWRGGCWWRRTTAASRPAGAGGRATHDR
jgi:serine/threonine protein kinase